MARLLRSAIVALALAGVMAPAIAAAADLVETGRRIYQDGVLGDGSPLRATRLDGAAVTGPTAACAACHRPSGMGAVEGDIQAPPVTGPALFGVGERVVATMDPRSGKAFNRAHDPYDAATFAAAVRTGRRIDGQPMQALMPRYALREDDLAALRAYLLQLSATWSPGVEQDTIHFATVITPDVPAERRALFIDMVRKIVNQKNGSTIVASQNRGRRHMTSAAELVLGTERRWTIDFWELSGPADTWAGQLDAWQARRPVFALVSGLSGDDWGPVADFCERRSVPCWFPSVDLPPPGKPRYSLYFNEGVALEASVLASRLRAGPAGPPRRLIQVYRDGAVGRGASAALRAALVGAGIDVSDRVLTAASTSSLLADAGAGDAVMLWLPAADVARLASTPPPPAAVFFSGILGGVDEAAVPAAWRGKARVVYPYELPERRAANLAYFKAWLNQRHIPLVDETLQSEVYFAFAYLTDTVSEMLDNLYADYLIERAETMINRREGAKAEAEYYSSTQSHVRTHSQSADGVIDARPVAPEAPALLAQRLAGSSYGRREGTTAYPRLTLGPGQRFASKGGYIARFDDAGALVADGGWIVP